MCDENSMRSKDEYLENSLLEETLMSLDTIKESAIDASVRYYSKKFDRFFDHLIESNDPNIAREMSEKLAKLKQNHMELYSSLIDKQMKDSLELFVKSEQIVDKLKFIESNDLIADDLFNVRKLVLPIKNDYLNELRDIERKLSEQYMEKSSEYERIKTCFDERSNKYADIRKLLYKKIVSISNQLEDIDDEALVSLEI